MQELSDSIKRPNLRIMGIEEEEVQAKGICTIFDKIIENFPNPKKKFFPVRYRKLPEHQIDLTKIEPPHSILSSIQQAPRTEKEGCKREKNE
jgi:hypothetical protein